MLSQPETLEAVLRRVFSFRHNAFLLQEVLGVATNTTNPGTNFSTNNQATCLQVEFLQQEQAVLICLARAESCLIIVRLAE